MKTAREGIYMIIGALVLGGIMIASSLVYSPPIEQPVAVKKPELVINKEVFSITPPKIQANEATKWVEPIKVEGLEPLMDTLKGFGDLISQPFSELGAGSEFAKKDAEIIQQTKEVFRNPANFTLGQECGLPGAAFTYPPGYDDIKTACGGTPGFGGTSCNTSPQCYFTGKCFWVCTPNTCNCYIPSCYGKCGKSSAYIWDSVTHTCGCGANKGGGDDTNQCQSSDDRIAQFNPPESPPDEILDQTDSQDFANQTDFSCSSGTDTCTVADGLTFGGNRNPNGPTVLFDESMTQEQKDQWLANSQGAMSACGKQDQYIFVANDQNAQKMFTDMKLKNVKNTCGVTTKDTSFPNDGDAGLFSGIIINADSENIDCIGHELGHDIIDQCLGDYGANDPTLQDLLNQQKKATDACAEPVSDYSLTSPEEFGAEALGNYCSTGGAYQPADPQTAQIYNQTIDYMKSNGCIQ